MDERILEMAELYNRILQLEDLQRLRASQDSSDAIRDHIESLRKKLLELKAANIGRTNA